MKSILISIFVLLIFVSFGYTDPGDKADKTRTFTWTANTEPDLAGYRIYHEKKFLVDITDPSVTSFKYLVEGLLEGNNVFNLTAYDLVGNESDFSGDAVFVYDSTAPIDPIEFIILKQTPKSRVTIETWE